jgi:hypothetical protein
MQTDRELLEYVAYLETALKTAREDIDLLRDEICDLEEERSTYRHLWMTECRYSNSLIEGGAELCGGISQVWSSERSSPHYRCMSLLSSSRHSASDAVSLDSPASHLQRSSP